jgi:hypothetical protein
MDFEHYANSGMAKRVWEEYKPLLSGYIEDIITEDVQIILDSCETAIDLDLALHHLLTIKQTQPHYNNFKITRRGKVSIGLKSRQIQTPILESGSDMVRLLADQEDLDHAYFEMQGSWDDGVRVLEGDRR